MRPWWLGAVIVLGLGACRSSSSPESTAAVAPVPEPVIEGELVAKPEARESPEAEPSAPGSSEAPQEAAEPEELLLAAAARYDRGEVMRVFGMICVEDAYAPCYTEHAELLLAEGHPIPALWGLRIALDEDDAPASAVAAQQLALSKAREQVERFADGLVGPGRKEAAALSGKAFARQLAAQAKTHGADTGSFIHPRLGLHVVHNILGEMLELERVTSWPAGEYNYADYVDTSSLVRAARLPNRARVKTDRSGCQTVLSAAVKGAGRIFERWSVPLGSESWAVPEELWLASREQFISSYGYDPEAMDGVELMREAALTVSHTVYLERVVYEFGRIDERWYLLAVLIEGDSCG